MPPISTGPPRNPSGAIAAVSLDFGGTLAFEVPSRAALYAEEARAVGLDVTDAGMEACMARVHAEMPREVQGAFRYSDAWFRAFQRRVLVDELGLSPEHLPGASARIFRRFEDPASFRLHPGARELIGALRAARLRVGIVSNWSVHLPRLLVGLGLDAGLDFVLVSAIERLEKPDRALFERAAARAGAEPMRCLHAGDRLHDDARGALGAGFRAVLVDHGGLHGLSANSPCPVVAGLAELQDLILGDRG